MDRVTTRVTRPPLHELPGHLLWRAAARATRTAEEILPPGTDWHACTALIALGETQPLSQRSLAEVIGVSATTLTGLAGALQDEGLMARVRNPADRRCYALSRTAAGRDAVRRWQPALDRLEQTVTAPLGPSEARRLRELLHQVCVGLIAPTTPPVLLESTTFLLTRAHRRAHRDFRGLLAPLGLDPRDVGALRCLRAAGSASQSELAGLLDVSAATVVEIVDHLERAGLVTREADGDRRVHRLRLQPAALPVLERCLTLSRRLLQDRLGGDGSPDRGDLVRLLGALLAETSVPGFAGQVGTR